MTAVDYIGAFKDPLAGLLLFLLVSVALFAANLIRLDRASRGRVEEAFGKGAEAIAATADAINRAREEMARSREAMDRQTEVVRYLVTTMQRRDEAVDRMLSDRRSGSGG